MMSSLAALGTEFADLNDKCLFDWDETTEAPSDSEGSSKEKELFCELVDLSAEEGRRRGQEILALLECSPVAAVAPPPPAVPLGASFGSRKSQLSGAATAFVPKAAARPDLAEEAECSMWTEAVNAAALQAFGDQVQEVEGSIQDGFAVRLQTSGEGRDMEQELDLLGNALWLQLGKDVWRFQPTVIPKRAWLTLDVYRMPERSRAEALCWEFAEQGVCPRGSFCRWQHQRPTAYSVDVELL